MAQRHFYFAFENLDLSGEDWDDLVQRFKQRGSTDDPQPARRNHWRYRTDEQAIIFEALFNEQAVNENAVRGILTSITGVPPPRIDYETVDNVTTFAIDSTDALIQRMFGEDDAIWMESGDECRAYLKANQEDWDIQE